MQFLLFFIAILLPVGFPQQATAMIHGYPSQTSKKESALENVLRNIPEVFVGRSKNKFIRGTAVETLYYGGSPAFKIPYDSTGPLGKRVWLVVKMNEDSRNIWEVHQREEPVMFFETDEDSVEIPFKFLADLDETGTLHINTHTRMKGQLSEYLWAANEYTNTLAYFGSDRVNAIEVFWPSPDEWLDSDNLASFNAAIAPPLSLPIEQAVWQTHEGKQARRLGFTQVWIDPDEYPRFTSRNPDQYYEVKGVYFLKHAQTDRHIDNWNY